MGRGRFGRLGAGGIFLIGLIFAALIFPWLGRWVWWAELFSHFVPQYAVLALVLGIVYSVRHRPWLAGVALTICVIEMLRWAPLWLPNVPESAAGGRRLTILQLNVNAYHSNPQRVVEWVMAQDADVAVLVEVPPTWRSFLAPVAARYPSTLMKLPAKGTGIAVFSRRASSLRIVSVGDPWCPAVVLTLPLSPGGGRLAVYATHLASPMGPADAEARNRQLTALGRRVASDPSARKIVVGDLNVTRWSPWFREVVAPAGLRDAQEGFGSRSTWPTVLTPWVGVAIDHTLISAGIEVIRRTVGPDLGSDHLPVVTIMAFPHAPAYEADDGDFSA